MNDIGVGIDIGTTAVKLVAASTDGDILFEDSTEHPLLSRQSGFAEEDPGLWWSGTLELLRRLAETIDPARVAAISCSGMVPTVILVDADGLPVRHSIQQNDARATHEIAAWKRRIDEDAYFRRTGNTVNQQVVFPKLEWLQTHEPAHVARTALVMGSYDYIGYRLTGVPVVERNWALESGLWQLDEEAWDGEVLELLGIPRSWLPPVKRSGELIGGLTTGVASETGLLEGTPVVTGIADHVASAFASGVVANGDMLLKLGGAGDILVAADSAKVNPRLFIDYHPLPGKFLLNGCMAASGSVIRWLLEIFRDADLDTLTKQAAELPPGSDGLVALPYFLGEKTPIFDTDARGVFFGLTLSHGRAHLFRAVLEAVAFGFMHHVEILKDMGIKPTQAFLSNGGARSPLWKQIVLDVVGLPGTYVPNHPGSCIGAAFVAMDGVGAAPEWKPLHRFLQRGERIDYSPENHQRYEHYFTVYRDLYERLRTLFPELGEDPHEEDSDG